MQAASENKRGLSANVLKTIAIAAMTIDHAAWVLFPGYDMRLFVLALHALGRITAPIMCFFIAEGYYHTKNVRRYAMRLLLFAVVGHFAYNFAFGIPLVPFADGNVFNQTSVLWALFVGLVALIVTDEGTKLPDWCKVIIFFLLLAIAFCADWSCIAVLVIAWFFKHRGNFRAQAWSLMAWAAVYAAVYCAFLDVRYGILQLAVALSLPLLARYDGTRGKRAIKDGKKGGKWFFYWYYPFHLVLCGLLRIYMGVGRITPMG